MIPAPKNAKFPQDEEWNVAPIPLLRIPDVSPAPIFICAVVAGLLAVLLVSALFLHRHTMIEQGSQPLEKELSR